MSAEHSPKRRRVSSGDPTNSKDGVYDQMIARGRTLLQRLPFDLRNAVCLFVDAFSVDVKLPDCDPEPCACSLRSSDVRAMDLTAVKKGSLDVTIRAHFDSTHRWFCFATSLFVQHLVKYCYGYYADDESRSVHLYVRSWDLSLGHEKWDVFDLILPNPRERLLRLFVYGDRQGRIQLSENPNPDSRKYRSRELGLSRSVFNDPPPLDPDVQCSHILDFVDCDVLHVTELKPGRKYISTGASDPQLIHISSLSTGGMNPDLSKISPSSLGSLSVDAFTPASFPAPIASSLRRLEMVRGLNHSGVLATLRNLVFLSFAMVPAHWVSLQKLLRFDCLRSLELAFLMERSWNAHAPPKSLVLASASLRRIHFLLFYSQDQRMWEQLCSAFSGCTALRSLAGIRPISDYALLSRTFPSLEDCRFEERSGFTLSISDLSSNESFAQFGSSVHIHLETWRFIDTWTLFGLGKTCRSIHCCADDPKAKAKKKGTKTDHQRSLNSMELLLNLIADLAGSDYRLRSLELDLRECLLSDFRSWEQIQVRFDGTCLSRLLVRGWNQYIEFARGATIECFGLKEKMPARLELPASAQDDECGVM